MVQRCNASGDSKAMVFSPEMWELTDKHGDILGILFQKRYAAHIEPVRSSAPLIRWLLISMLGLDKSITRDFLQVVFQRVQRAKLQKNHEILRSHYSLTLECSLRMFAAPFGVLPWESEGGTAMFAFKFWWWWVQTSKHPESVLLEVCRFQLIQIRVSRYSIRGPWLVKMCKFLVEARTKVRGAFLTSLRRHWCYIWLWIACEKFYSDGPYFNALVRASYWGDIDYLRIQPTLQKCEPMAGLISTVASPCGR